MSLRFSSPNEPQAGASSNARLITFVQSIRPSYFRCGFGTIGGTSLACFPGAARHCEQHDSAQVGA